jgi:hypothetical protein
MRDYDAFGARKSALNRCYARAARRKKGRTKKETAGRKSGKPRLVSVLREKRKAAIGDR